MPSKSAQTAPQTKNAGPKLPVKTLRLGRIKAAVWENESDSKKFYNVTFARTYVDEAKNYHDTDMRPGDEKIGHRRLDAIEGIEPPLENLNHGIRPYISDLPANHVAVEPVPF